MTRETLKKAKELEELICTIENIQQRFGKNESIEIKCYLHYQLPIEIQKGLAEWLGEKKRECEKKLEEL